MQTNMLPFNIDLLVPKENDLKGMKQIKVLDIFDGFSRNFHPDGLFSVEIFGKVGEERRNRLFAYIDMGVEIFHPVVYKAICDLKELYGEILMGRGYAVFNPATKDFEKATIANGDTGYSFFVSHFKDLEFEKRPSSKREFNIKLINKYRTNCMFSKLLVLPAGLRDYVIDDNGKPSKDEVNDLYHKVMSIAAMTANINAKLNIEFLDTTRANLQLAVCNTYNYIKSLLEGKSKFVLSKWAGRKTINSTRNVVTSYIPDYTTLHGIKTVSSNQTVCGLFQYLRAIMPLAVNRVRDTYLTQVFVGPNSPAVLVNKKTLRKELVEVDPEHYDDWMTFEGLEHTMALFGNDNLRHDFLEVEDHYLGLVYLGEIGGKKVVKFLQDITELPEELDPKNVRPITFTELLYLSVFEIVPRTPGFFSRYPITGYGSIYPCEIYLKTTVKSEVRVVLNELWQPTEVVAAEFPIYESPFYNSMSPASVHLSRLDADFDGDVCSLTCVITDDAVDEIKKFLRSRNYYVGINGSMAFSADEDVISLILKNITG